MLDQRNLKITTISLLAGILILGGYYVGWDYFVRQINEDCSEDYTLGVFTPVQNISTGKCEIFPNSCIPVGFVADDRCTDEWQRSIEVEREISTDQQSQADISTWQTYRNERYGFEVKFPLGWRVTTSQDLVDMIFISPINKESPHTYLAILPHGEFDYGIPYEKPTISIIQLGGKPANLTRWYGIDRLGPNFELRLITFADTQILGEKIIV